MFEEHIAKDEFERLMRRVLDGIADDGERAHFTEALRGNPERMAEYVEYMLLIASAQCLGQDGCFAAERETLREKACGRPARTFWLWRGAVWKVAAAAAAAVAAVAVWGIFSAVQLTGLDGIVAEPYDEQEEWLAQLTPLDMQAYREHMGFDAVQTELEPLQKYEPGLIPNPGASIEIVDLEGCDLQPRLLEKGDRVWRDKITLDSGKMVFRTETGVLVTLFGPAVIELHSAGALTLESGMLLAECGEEPLRVAVREMIVQNRNVTFCVNVSDHLTGDVVVLSGTLQAAFVDCGRLGHLAAGDGIRFLKDRRIVRFRCLMPEVELRARFFAGNSLITMKHRRKT